MDERDRDDDMTPEPPAAEPPAAAEEPPAEHDSGRVRIIGAEPAGLPAEPESRPTGSLFGGTGDDPLDPSDAWPSDDRWASPLADDEPTGAEASAAGTVPADGGTDVDLPHWTEAPTGEVPAVLARDTPGADQWSSVPAPTWREEHSDWEANEEAFDAAMMLGDDQPIAGRHDTLNEERQPWSFELDEPGVPEAGGRPASLLDDLADDQTAVVPAVRPEEPDAGSPAPSSERPVVARPPAAEAAGARPTGATSGWLHDLDAGPAAPPAAGEPLGGPSDDELPEGGRAVRRRLGRRAVPQPAAEPEPEPTRSLLVGDLGPDLPVLEGDDPLVAGAPSPPPRTGRRRVSRPVPQAPPDPVGGSGRLRGGSRPVPQAPPNGSAARTRVPLRPPPQASPPAAAAASGAAGRNLPVAVAAGLLLGALALLAFDLGPLPSMVIATAVVFLAAVEAFTAFRRAGYQPAVLLGWVAVVSLMIATYNKGEVALPLMVVATVAVTLVWYLAGVEPGADPLRGTATTVFVFCWIGVFGSYAALLLNQNLFPDRHGVAFVFGAVIATVANDAAAFFGGRAFGRHPLSSVSPGKSWEGALAGGIASVLAGLVVIRFLHPFTPAAAVTLGVVVAFVAPLGDLCESMVKRQLGLKDMGRILPGHGGLLDRVDGLLFVLPATYYLVKAFHLG